MTGIFRWLVTLGVGILGGCLLACKEGAVSGIEECFPGYNGIPFGNETIDLIVEENMLRHRLVGLGLAFYSLGNEGRVIRTYHQGFGWDRFDDRKCVDRDKTQFRLASLSKGLTGTLSLILSERGYLDLDRSIESIVREGSLEPELLDLRSERTYVQPKCLFSEEPYDPDLDIRDITCDNCDDYGTVYGLPSCRRMDVQITTRMLLSNSAGIMDYYNSVSNGRPIESELEEYKDDKDFLWALGQFKNMPLTGVPGESYNYSTLGFNLVGLILTMAHPERMSYWEQFKGYIKEPLGLTSIYPDFQPDANHDEVPEHRTVGYEDSGELVLEMDRTRETYSAALLPGGGFVGSADDLGRFCAGLMNGDLLSEESVEDDLWSPQGVHENYGLGFRVGKLHDFYDDVRDGNTDFKLDEFISKHQNERVVYHSGGGIIQTSTLFFILPDSGSCLVLLSNTKKRSQALGEIALEIVNTL